MSSLISWIVLMFISRKRTCIACLGVSRNICVHVISDIAAHIFYIRFFQSKVKMRRRKKSSSKSGNGGGGTTDAGTDDEGFESSRNNGGNGVPTGNGTGSGHLRAPLARQETDLSDVSNGQTANNSANVPEKQNEEKDGGKDTNEGERKDDTEEETKELTVVKTFFSLWLN